MFKCPPPRAEPRARGKERAGAALMTLGAVAVLAAAAGEFGEGVAGAEDADVAEGGQVQQVSIPGDDQDGCGGERAGQDVVVVRITAPAAAAAAAGR
jgi:hypothetical protein